jgi:hypothetical protein
MARNETNGHRRRRAVKLWDGLRQKTISRYCPFNIFKGFWRIY